VNDEKEDEQAAPEPPVEAREQSADPRLENRVTLGRVIGRKPSSN
jgi:hypothetical protein